MNANNDIYAANPHPSRFKRKSRVVTTLAGLLALGMLSFAGIAPAVAATKTVSLQTAGNYSVLAGTTVTKTGTSILGQIGLSPGISLTGLLGGVTGSNNNTAVTAQADLALAYADAERRPATATVSAQLGGQKLTDGVYQSNTGAFRLNGTLTLDGQNNPNSVFILKADALSTGVASRINLVNGAQACNVFFLVEGSAVLGSNSVFAGTVLALNSITAQANAKIEGRLLARNGAVNLNANIFAAPGCNKTVASASLTTPSLTSSLTNPSVASSGISAQVGTSPLVAGLSARTPAVIPADSTPVTVPAPAVPPTSPDTPVTSPNDGSGAGAGSDSGTISGNGTDANSGVGASGTGTQDDPTVVTSENGFVAARDFPAEQSYAAASSQDQLSETGLNKLIPVATLMGLILLFTGAAFLFLNRHRLQN